MLAVLAISAALLAPQDTSPPVRLVSYEETVRCAGLAQAASELEGGESGEGRKLYDAALYWSLTATQVGRLSGRPAETIDADQTRARIRAVRQLSADDAEARAALARCRQRTRTWADEAVMSPRRTLRAALRLLRMPWDRLRGPEAGRPERQSTMFEFGKDLRKLFAQARESEDLGWLELIGVDLLAVEARQQATDAGRVSCARPSRTALRASGLWREHARRTGRADSLDRALKCAAEAGCAARTDDDMARASIAAAQTHLLRFDLSGGLEFLAQAAGGLAAVGLVRRGDTSATLSAVSARVAARQARLAEDPARTLAALAPMDEALRKLEGRDTPERDDLRLDRAALTLELGIIRRDSRLLDQAGRALTEMVEGASPDYRPLTRARALALCGAGLSALAAMADDPQAATQGRSMFDAAADQFTPDHSPLDWVAIQIVRAADPDAVPVESLMQAERLSQGQALVLGALARDLRIERQIELAEATSDLATIAGVEADVRRRLSLRGAAPAPLDWAVDQIAMGRLALARAVLSGVQTGAAGFGLTEAAAIAREHGVPAIAVRADSLVRRLTVKA